MNANKELHQESTLEAQADQSGFRTPTESTTVRLSGGHVLGLNPQSLLPSCVSRHEAVLLSIYSSKQTTFKSGSLLSQSVLSKHLLILSGSFLCRS